MNNDQIPNIPNTQPVPCKPEPPPTDWGKLKVELNNITIMHGPPNVTIAQAEEAMMAYINILTAYHFNVDMSVANQLREKWTS